MSHRNIEVILIGGKLFKHSVVAVGAPAIENIRRIHADTYFMGVTGIHPEVGLTTGDFEEAHVKRALSASAAETIVLASSEKLNAVSPVRHCAHLRSHRNDRRRVSEEKSPGAIRPPWPHDHESGRARLVRRRLLSP